MSSATRVMIALAVAWGGLTSGAQGEPQLTLRHVKWDILAVDWFMPSNTLYGIEQSMDLQNWQTFTVWATNEVARFSGWRSNHYTWATNSAQFFRLRKQGPPRIAQATPDVSAFVGDSVELGAETDGWPLTFQWHRGSLKLEGETNRILRFSSVRTNDAGEYRLWVGSGIDYSGLVYTSRLSVIERPSIVPPNLHGARMFWLVTDGDVLPSGSMVFLDLPGTRTRRCYIRFDQGSMDGDYTFQRIGTNSAVLSLLSVRLNITGSPIKEIRNTTGIMSFATPTNGSIILSALEKEQHATFTIE